MINAHVAVDQGKEDQAMNRTDEDVLKYGYFLFC